MRRFASCLVGSAAIACVASCAALTAPGASNAPAGARPGALDNQARYGLLTAPSVCPVTCNAAAGGGSYLVGQTTERVIFSLIDRSDGNDLGHLTFASGGSDFSAADGFPASNFAGQIAGTVVTITGTALELGGGSGSLAVAFSFDTATSSGTLTINGTPHPVSATGIIVPGSCEFVEPG